MGLAKLTTCFLFTCSRCIRLSVLSAPRLPVAKMTTNDDVVITPRNPETLHNFGPASSRDAIVYTSERPGGDPEGNAKIPTSKVVEWIDFMKGQNVQQVMVLLDDNELYGTYEEPGLLELYKQNGLKAHRNVMGITGSSTNAERILKEAEAADEKIVAHCTGGIGRCGRVAAGWLVMRYRLSPQDATNEAIEIARRNGQERMGNAKALEKWLNNR